MDGFFLGGWLKFKLEGFGSGRVKEWKGSGRKKALRQRRGLRRQGLKGG